MFLQEDIALQAVSLHLLVQSVCVCSIVIMATDCPIAVLCLIVLPVSVFSRAFICVLKRYLFFFFFEKCILISWSLANFFFSRVGFCPAYFFSFVKSYPLHFSLLILMCHYSSWSGAHLWGQKAAFTRENLLISSASCHEVCHLSTWDRLQHEQQPSFNG